MLEFLPGNPMSGRRWQVRMLPHDRPPHRQPPVPRPPQKKSRPLFLSHRSTGRKNLHVPVAEEEGS